ncbi:MAG: hypothetical protein RL189_1934 [Pseudomonadota bacterium]
MDISKASLILGSFGLIGVGMTFGSLLFKSERSSATQNSSVVLMAPAPDNKTELAYRRSGFGDRIMTPQRREALSTCYKELLKRNGIEEGAKATTSSTQNKDISKFEGKVTYVFQVAENGEKISHEIVDAQINENTFLSCIEVALRGVRFLPPPLGISRYLAHEFTFKSEETFRKEMEERKNQEPLVLVTATPQK